MKKLTALLLTLILLLPTLAVAEDSADLPTFDFTAEEWLARYQEVVGEGDPYYFTEFSEEGVFPEAFFFPGPYAREQFGELAGTGVTLVSDADSGKVVRMWVSVSTKDLPGVISDVTIYDPKLIELTSMARWCLMATDTALSVEEIEMMLSSIIPQKARWEMFEGESFAESPSAKLSFSYSYNFEIMITPI